MTYEFVTEEQIRWAGSTTLPSLAERLLRERDAALASVAGLLCGSDFDLCAKDHMPGAIKHVRRILEEEK